MTETEREAQEIITNAIAQYRLGNIDLDDLMSIWRRAGVDAELQETADAL